MSVIQPTTQIKSQPNQITINKTFNETWEDMVEFISTSYFGIDAFEKESGLLTLSFGEENPGRYIDCGEIHGPNYSGPLTNAANTIPVTSHVLEGRMNVFLHSESPNVTTVRVTARYVYTIQDAQFRQIWAFNSNTSDTKSLNQAQGVTCVSKQVAENELLEGIKFTASGK
ncbi:MAG: hypothetical protein IH948_09180 [Bacteroidetes bacterium]|nr:hypothetical protein [Bacteroidota bacterium]